MGLTIREFNETGFHPGVYDYPDNSAEYINADWFANTGKSQPLMDAITNFNLFEVPLPPDQSTVPVQR